MLTLESLMLFIPTVAILVMLPGPDFAVVSKISIFNGHKAAQASAWGVTLGMCVHTLLAMLGLSAIIASSAVLFSIIKYAGAVYLLYVGISELVKSFRTKDFKILQSENAENIPKGNARYFYAGFFTNVLNPKAILYFMVLYPQFINPAASLTPQFLEMGLISALICLVWYLMLATVFTKMRSFFTGSSLQRWLLRVSGAIFISFACKLALQKME